MQKVFTAPYTVTIGDINYGRHLGNDRSLVIFQDARIRFLRSMGFSEANIGEEKAVVVVEAGCRYLKQVFLHEELIVQVAIGEMEGKRCRLDYTVVREKDGQVVLTGFTVMLAYDNDIRKVVKLPDPFLHSCRLWLTKDEQQDSFQNTTSE